LKKNSLQNQKKPENNKNFSKKNKKTSDFCM